MTTQPPADEHDAEAVALTLLFLWSLLFGFMIGLGHGFPFGGAALPALYWLIWGGLEVAFGLCVVVPSVRRSRT
jgi:hypothetical protein